LCLTCACTQRDRRSTIVTATRPGRVTVVATPPYLWVTIISGLLAIAGLVVLWSSQASDYFRSA
jgi:hypothetical protein